MITEITPEEIVDYVGIRCGNVDMLATVYDNMVLSDSATLTVFNSDGSVLITIHSPKAIYTFVEQITEDSPVYEDIHKIMKRGHDLEWV